MQGATARKHMHGHLSHARQNLQPSQGRLMRRSCGISSGAPPHRSANGKAARLPTSRWCRRDTLHRPQGRTYVGVQAVRTLGCRRGGRETFRCDHRARVRDCATSRTRWPSAFKAGVGLGSRAGRTLRLCHPSEHPRAGHTGRSELARAPAGNDASHRQGRFGGQDTGARWRRFRPCRNRVDARDGRRHDQPLLGRSGNRGTGRPPQS